MQNKLNMMMVVIFLCLSLVEHHGRFPYSMFGLAISISLNHAILAVLGTASDISVFWEMGCEVFVEPRVGKRQVGLEIVEIGP